MDNNTIKEYILQNKNNIQDTILYALFHQLSEENRKEVRNEIFLFSRESENTIGQSSEEYISPIFQDFPKNPAIETLYRWFNNPKSKKIQQARYILRERFPYQSYSVQKKIIDIFIKRGSRTDVKWAAKYLLKKMFWKDDYLSAVKKVWQLEKDNWMLAQIVSTKASIDFIESIIDDIPTNEINTIMGSISFHYDLFATRLAIEKPDYVIDKTKMLPMQYIICCAKANRKVTHEEAIEGFYDCIAVFFNRLHDFYEILCSKTFNLFFYCLRDLGMAQEIMECSDWIIKVSNLIQKRMSNLFSIDFDFNNRNMYLDPQQARYRYYINQSVVRQCFPKEYMHLVRQKDSNHGYEEREEARDQNKALYEESLEEGSDYIPF